MPTVPKVVLFAEEQMIVQINVSARIYELLTSAEGIPVGNVTMRLVRDRDSVFDVVLTVDG